MTHAIRKHIGDFIAIIALVAIGLGTAGYILVNQAARPVIPFVEDKPVKLQAEFSDAQAVTPGQGQSVRVAGVEIGKIGKVKLEDGKAIVDMNIKKEFAEYVHRDASALLRPRTGLKDMFIELDPGTRSAAVMKEGERIGVENTRPDIDPDEILSALDTDTRAYLQLLVNGLGKGLKGRGDDLREVFKRFEPLHRDLARVQGAFAERRQGLSRLIHNYGSLTNELADKDQDLTRLVEASGQVFEAFASEDDNISESFRRFPSALRQTESTLAKVDTLGGRLGPALESLRPAFRQLDVANRQVLPFVREAEPIVRTQIRPFVREARPYLRDLRPAATNLAKATPDLTASFGELNRFFNMAAFNPKGAEKLTGDRAKDKQRDEGYLFWLAWTVQNGNSVFSTSDASGPLRRTFVNATCQNLRDALNTLAAQVGPLAPAISGINPALLSNPAVCPDAASGAAAKSRAQAKKTAARDDSDPEARE